MAEYGWGYNSAVPDRLAQMRMGIQGQQSGQAMPMGQNVGQMGQQGVDVNGNGSMTSCGSQMNAFQDVPNGWVGLNWVVSEAEAQCMPVQWGSTAVAFDYNDQVAYIKSVSPTGKPGFWAYRMVPLKPKTDAEYVTREEYTKLLDENNRMMAVVQRLAQEWGLSDERKSNDHADTTVRPELQGEQS